MLLILRMARGVCLICFCVLVAAVAVAVAALTMPNLIAEATGCRLDVTVLASVQCREGRYARLFEIVLNLPLLFIYAPAFTLVGPAAPNPDFMRLLWAIDGVIALALLYVIWVLIARRLRRRNG